MMDAFGCADVVTQDYIVEKVEKFCLDYQYHEDTESGREHKDPTYQTFFKPHHCLYVIIIVLLLEKKRMNPSAEISSFYFVQFRAIF